MLSQTDKLSAALTMIGYVRFNFGEDCAHGIYPKIEFFTPDLPCSWVDDSVE